MTAIATLPVLFGTGIHSARPAASSVGKGGLYSCTTHSLVYQTDGSSWTTWATLTGSGFADPMTTRGDTIYRNASNATDRLAIPAAGQVLGRVGSDLGSLYPPGYEFDYTAKTSSTSITATTEGTAQTVVTGGSVTYDGSTAVVIEFFAPALFTGAPGSGTPYIIVLLYEDSTLLGQIGALRDMVGSPQMFGPLYSRLRRTPSNASHQYVVKAYVSAGTGSVEGGTGGTGNYVAAYVRVTKV